MSRNRFIIIVATVLSLFGITVAGISTFAWFQLNTVSKTSPASNVLDTDTTDLQVKSVSGYKYTYDQIADGQTAATGTITGQSAYGNIDEDLVTAIDAPQEGVGFYILGDASWATVVTGDTNDAMTYRSAVKMTEQYDDNFAVIDGLYLVAGQEIMIKQYTYDEVGGTVKPVSYTVSNLSAAGTYQDEPNDPADFLTSSSGVLTVKTGKTGIYKMYVNNQRQIYLHPSGTGQTQPVRKSSKITKRSTVSESINTIRIFLQDESTTWWSYSGDDDRIPRIHLSNIVFEDDANFGNLAYTSLPSVTNLTYISKTVANAKMTHKGTDGNNKTWEFIFPWYIKSFNYNYYVNSHNYPNNAGYYDTNTGPSYIANSDNTNTWESSATRATNSEYKDFFYDVFEKDTYVSANNYKRQGGMSHLNDSNHTDSVQKYTITYYKNDINTSYGDSVIRYYNSYYLPEDSYKTATGVAGDVWKRWEDTSGNTYVGGFLTASDSAVSIVGIFASKAYFKLYIVKQRYNGGTPSYDPAVQFDGNGEGYYTSDDQTQFDPSTILTDSAFSGLSYGGNYTYTASTAVWKIGSRTGGTYNKSTFDDFEYSSASATCLYVTVVEKTLTIKKYWVTLETDWATVDDALADGSPVEETWGADTANTPAAFATTDFTNNGLTNYTDYEEYDSSWRSGATLGSSTVSFPKTYNTTTTQKIYKFYRPIKNVVTYNYEFYYREKTGVTASGTPIYGDYISYDKITTTITESYDCFATTPFTLAAHHPYFESYSVTDLQDKAVYRFYWDEKLYNSSTGAEFTSATFGPSSTAAERTFTVKMYATWENIYVANECTTDANWYSVKNYYLQVRGVSDGGDTNLHAEIDSSGNEVSVSNNKTYVGPSSSAYRFLMNRDGEDGVNSFRISDGISFAVNNGTSDGTANYTTMTTNTSSPDSYSTARGHFSDTIAITDNVIGDYSRKWRWSTYFGTASKSAGIFFQDDDLNKSMYEGDGKFNLFVYDSGYNLAAGNKFAIRLAVNGTYKWFDYDDLDADSKLIVGEGGALADLGNEADDAAIKSTTTTVDNAISIRTTATYNFYFTTESKISIVTAPSKGDGYYIMNYDPLGAHGNASLNSYVGGVKMRRTGYSYGYNVAYYNCFNISSDCLKIYLKSYIGGVDQGPFLNLDSTELASIDGNGVITFENPGNYSIFLQLNLVDSRDVYTIFITSYPDNFYILNKLPDEAGKGLSDQVIDFNTSLILEVEFTYSADVANRAMIGIDVNRSASGASAKLSQFLVFNVLCSTTKLGTTSYATMREDSIYGAAEAFDTDALKLTVFDETNTITADTSGDPPSLYLYILIDYADFSIKEAAVADMANDFTMSLRARSL